MRITLHIGLPKTGTTAIQRTLEKNREKLIVQGCLFPKTPIALWGGHHKIFQQVCPLSCQEESRVLCGLQDNADLLAQRSKFPDELRAEIEKNKPDHLILSAEQLSMWLWQTEHIKSVKKFLEQFSNKIEVIVYLREQSRILASYYTQMIVAGCTERFQLTFPENGEAVTNAFERRFLKFYSDNPSGIYLHDPFPFWLDYAKLTDLWAQEFGDSSIKVRIFERDKLIGGDVVNDFILSADIKLIEDLKFLGEVHPSPSERGMKMLRMYNLIVPRFRNGRLNPTRMRLTQGGIFRRIHGNPFKLSKNQATELQQFFGKGNAEVSNRFLGSKAPLFCK